MKNILVFAIVLVLSLQVQAKKVLLVVTNHSDLGGTGKKTGYYLPEVTHPYFKFIDAGHEVVFASPNGGKAPMDEKSRDMSDPLNKKFLESPKLMEMLKNTLPLAKVDVSSYAAVVFAGGHGTMWDFRSSREVKRVTKAIYEKGGVVAAVCHGPAALVDVKLSSGKYLLDGKRVTAFTNKEEDIVKLSSIMPFMLETAMIERGATFSKAAPWKESVVVDKRVVTGQNPASASRLGSEVVKLIGK